MKFFCLKNVYAFSELNSVGVVANKPEGTYYFMPDFEVCRSPIIQDGTALCEKLLQDANVAVHY